MRRLAAVEAGLALLLAFLLAPFQHVHPGQSNAGNFGELHAHFFAAHAHEHHRPSGSAAEMEADDNDDHTHARSIDTYTLLLPEGPHAILPSPALIVPSIETAAFPPLEFVEARANSPPVDRSAPRAPPL